MVRWSVFIKKIVSMKDVRNKLIKCFCAYTCATSPFCSNLKFPAIYLPGEQYLVLGCFAQDLQLFPRKL